MYVKMYVWIPSYERWLLKLKHVYMQLLVNYTPKYDVIMQMFLSARYGCACKGLELRG